MERKRVWPVVGAVAVVCLFLSLLSTHSRLTNLEEFLAKADNGLHKLATQLQKLSAQLEKNSKEVSSLKGVVQQPKNNDNEKSFAEFARALRRNGERLDTFEKNIITLQERIAKVTSDISEIQYSPPLSSLSPTISIIIPVFGDARATKARSLRGNQLSPILVFLEKEYAKTQNSFFEVIVVGEEGDKTLAPLKNSKLVNLVFMEKNRKGWVDYIEKGAKAARGDYFFFLSATTLVPTALDAYSLFTLEWTEALLALFKDENIALVSPKIISHEGHIYSTGLNLQSVTMEEEGKIMTRLLPVHQLQGFFESDQRSLVQQSIDVVASDAFIVRASAFKPLASSFLSLAKGAHPLLLTASISLFLKDEGLKAVYFPNLVVHKEYSAPSKSSAESYFSGDNIDKTSFYEFNKLWWVEGSPLRKSVESKRNLDLNIVWDFYCGCTGWNIEVISYASTLETQIPIKLVAGNSDCFCNGFPEQTIHALERMRSAPVPTKVDVWISHKPPTSYPSFPYNGAVFYVDRPTFVIGRSMIESDTVPSEWASKASLVNEIWVPATFLVPVFTNAGIDAQKIKVVPEQIDIHLWDPHAVINPFPLANYTYPSAVQANDFVFLSSFKWEHRKGWDLLLTAFFRQFRASDPVILVLHTYLYLDHDPRNPERVQQTIMNWLEVDAPSDVRKISDRARYVIITDELPQMVMPSLYKAAHAFVLPTRGEGWGLPIMQAMAMELPTIATAWSGPLDFMTTTTAYMLPIEDDLIPAEKEGFGKMAQPSVTKLAELLHAVSDTTNSEVKEKGLAARKHIVENFSAEVVSEIWMSNFQRLYKSIV